MTSSDKKALEYAIDEITEIATGFGLDFYTMRYVNWEYTVNLHQVGVGIIYARQK